MTHIRSASRYWPLVVLGLLAALAASVPLAEAKPAIRSAAQLQVRLAQRSLDGLVTRSVTAKPAVTKASSGLNTRVLHVKFKEGSLVRLRSGKVTTLGSDNLTGVHAVLARYPGAKLERMTHQTELQVAVEKAQIEKTSGKQQADFNLWYRMRLPAGATAAEVSDELNALPIVEIAYPEPLPAPLPVTPDFSADQEYAGAPGDGIGAYSAWTIPGGTGANVRIVDIEYSWNTAHEDLAASVGGNINNGTPVDPFTNNDHGTAVLGELIATSNGFGVTGLAYGAQIRMVNANNNTGYRLAEAINLARTNTVAGDVILLEQQTQGPNGGCNASGQVGCAPVEWFAAYYDAIVLATAANRFVVEAAGNGSQDLDGAEYNPWTSKANSNAIIVGAGGSNCFGGIRERLGFSNHGARVDLQGWGECVTTTGYGNLQGSSQSNDAYTSSFGGTSSASPIVSGAVALYSSVRQQNDGQDVVPTPAMVRNTLQILGSLQQDVNGEEIGPLPNLRLALSAYDTVPPDQPSMVLSDTSTGNGTSTNGDITAQITGTDNFAVNSYYANESPTTPLPFAGGWQSSSTYSLGAGGSDGVKTFYVWTKDSKNNISPRNEATIILETGRPAVTLKAPFKTNKRVTPIQFSGSDSAGSITGYLIKAQDSLDPLETDPLWTATAPTTYTFTGTSGQKTLYAWVKDSVGNISPKAARTLLFDNKKPVVTINAPANNSTKKTLSKLTGKATDNLPPQYKQADFTLFKRIGAGQCSFWNPIQHKLVNGPCNAPKRFLIKTAGNVPNWTRNIGTLNTPGKYTLTVRFIDGALNIGMANAIVTITGTSGSSPATR